MKLLMVVACGLTGFHWNLVAQESSEKPQDFAELIVRQGSDAESSAMVGYFKLKEGAEENFTTGVAVSTLNWQVTTQGSLTKIVATDEYDGVVVSFDLENTQRLDFELPKYNGARFTYVGRGLTTKPSKSVLPQADKVVKPKARSTSSSESTRSSYSEQSSYGGGGSSSSRGSSSSSGKSGDGWRSTPASQHSPAQQEAARNYRYGPAITPDSSEGRALLNRNR